VKRRCGMDARLLWEYQEGLLSPKQRERVARHVAECAECQEEMRRSEGVVAALKASRPEGAPASARRFVLREDVAPAPLWTLWRWPVTVGAVAVLALVSIGLFTTLPRGGSQAEKRQAVGVEDRGGAELGEAAPVAEGAASAGGREARSEGLGAAAEDTGRAVAGKATGPAAGPLVERLGREAVSPSPEQQARDRSVDRESLLDEPDGAGDRSKPADAEGLARREPTEGVAGRLQGGGRGGGVGGVQYETEGPGVVAGEALVGKLGQDRRCAANVTAYDEKDRLLGFYTLTEPSGSNDLVVGGLGATERGEAQLELHAAPAKGASDSYLGRKVTLEQKKAPLATVAFELSKQAGVPILLDKNLPQASVAAQFENVDFSVALAGLSFASNVQWCDEDGHIRLLARPASGAAGLGALAERGEADRATSLEYFNWAMLSPDEGASTRFRLGNVCSHCGRPDLGPMWDYCPFCGKRLER
jgi:hypothetical protein